MMTGMEGVEGGTDELEHTVALQQAAAYLMQQQQIADDELLRQGEQERQAQLATTIRVDSVPVTMTMEALIMILTGMFGEVKTYCAGMDYSTQHPFAVIEFKEQSAAAKATAAKEIKFGSDCLQIVLSSTLVDEGADASTMATVRSQIMRREDSAAGPSRVKEDSAKTRSRSPRRMIHLK